MVCERTRVASCSLLPAADFRQVARDLSHIELQRGSILATAGERIDHVYFLLSVDWVSCRHHSEGHKADAGMFGWDGYVPTSAATGLEISPHYVKKDTVCAKDG